MTDLEYHQQMGDILGSIPSEFRGYVERSAYDRGHSCGYEEVVMIAKEIVQDLSPCINDYYENC